MTTYRTQWTPSGSIGPDDPFTPNPIAERKFRDRIVVNEETDCWEWRGASHEGGYGRFYLNGKKHPAHRVSYSWFVGPIPDGLHIDHLCRNPPCVNPAHLEPVTSRENLMRGVNGERERTGRCMRGHKFDPVRANCRECDALRAANRRKRLGIVQGRGPRLIPSFSRFAVGGTADPAIAAEVLRAAGIDLGAMAPRSIRLRTLSNGRIDEVAANQSHRGSYAGVIFE